MVEGERLSCTCVNVIAADKRLLKKLTCMMAKLPIADVCQKIKLMGFPVKGKTILLNIMLGVR
jgi:hypothetical protein